MPVHRLGAIDHDNPPAPFGRGQAQKIGDLARVVDGYFGAHALALRIVGKFHR